MYNNYGPRARSVERGGFRGRGRSRVRRRSVERQPTMALVPAHPLRDDMRQLMADLRSAEEGQAPSFSNSMDLALIEPSTNRALEPMDIEQSTICEMTPQSSTTVNNVYPQARYEQPATTLKFCCQLAHGSPTAILTNFNNISELFSQIAEWFRISIEDILFCTKDTFKIDMENLFSGTLDVSEMLFVHVRGQPTEVTLTKTSSSLGVTIADNGLCRSFIKRIKTDSTMEKAFPAIKVGQLIEAVDGVSMLGYRHYEVARYLRSIPVGKTFTIRLVSPLESGFSMLAPRGAAVPKKSNVGNGLGTIRFKAEGGFVVQTELPDTKIVSKLNDLFETYLGVQDDQLAMSIWDMANSCNDLTQMKTALMGSELRLFDFPDELVFDMWGIVSDLRRAQNTTTGM